MADQHGKVVTLRAARLTVLAFAMAIAACSPEQAPEQKFNGTDITGVPWGRGFQLSDHNGRPRSLSDFKGKVVLLFFGYTSCPGPCPTALAEMAQVVKELGPDGERVQGLFVTVDPERDTPQRLATYLRSFDPSFLGLTGSKGDWTRQPRGSRCTTRRRSKMGTAIPATARTTITWSTTRRGFMPSISREMSGFSSAPTAGRSRRWSTT